MLNTKHVADGGIFGELGELFDNLINKSPMGIFLYALDDDDQLIFRGSNQTACDLLQIDCRNLIGKKIEEAFPRLAETELPEVYKRLAREGGNWHWEQVDYADERLAGAYSVYAFQTSPGRMAVMFLDITERKKTEVELECAKGALLAALEATPAGVIIADAPDGRIRLVNSAALEIRGVKSEMVMGIPVAEHARHWRMLQVDGQPYDAHKLPLSRAISTGETVCNEEATIVRDDGRHRRIIVNAAPVRDAGGKIVAGVVVFLDISERVKSELARSRLQRQMQQAQKLESLGILAGGIAHDFNNLLCVMLGGADLALEELPAGHAAREGVEMVRETASQATDLCRQMLAYSGKGKFCAEPLDLGELVHSMESLLHASISKKATLRVETAEDLPLIEGDATQMRQVILNLVVNASEAIGAADGDISVRLGGMDCDEMYLRSAYLEDSPASGRYAYIEISDTGCGMDKMTRARLFDPFYSTKKTGRGLGLAAVLGIVRGHCGTLKVYSEVDLGTTFKVLVPASGGKKIAKKPKAGDRAWRGTGWVLLVDDEPMVRRVGKLILERLGLEVLTASDGVAALEMYQENRSRIKLVILDMTMPRMNGQEAFKELRLIDPEIRVILTSGYNAQDATSHFAGKELAGFMQKPFMLETMREAISEALPSTTGKKQ